MQKIKTNLSVIAAIHVAVTTSEQINFVLGCEFFIACQHIDARY